MNYELAKQLKDAGFPQDKAKEALANVLTMDGGSTVTVVRNMPKAIPTTQVAMPTLEELIEACGGQFSLLRRDPTGWSAIGDQNKFSDAQSDRMQCGGPTPIEAVANLYIALYNKGNGTPNKNTKPD